MKKLIEKIKAKANKALISAKVAAETVIKNKKGEYGRTSPKKHIGPVNDWACDELPKEIERELT